MIDLNNGHIRLSIDPDQGAGIGRVEARINGQWQPVCVPAPDAPTPMPASHAGLFVMVPFANRARENLLGNGPQSWALSPNTNDPLALHGIGWQRPWAIADRSETSAELALSVADGFPFPWRARFRISLQENTLYCQLSITNDGQASIPVGMGFHPYFPRMPSTTLAFDADAYWHEGDNYLPTHSSPVTTENGYTKPRPLPEHWQNNCYTGWRGSARIEQPDLGYSLSLKGSEGLGALMLYSAPELTRFAVEPQSHLSGQTTVAKNGLRGLAPGTSWAEEMRIEVHSIGS